MDIFGAPYPVLRRHVYTIISALILVGIWAARFDLLELGVWIVAFFVARIAYHVGDVEP